MWKHPTVAFSNGNSQLLPCPRVPAHDLDGQPRPFGSLPDMGCDEMVDADSNGTPEWPANPVLPLASPGAPAPRNKTLVYYGYRWYDPDMGRWISRDPLGETGETANLRAFCNNDPLRNHDLLGLFLRSFFLGYDAKRASIREQSAIDDYVAGLKLVRERVDPQDPKGISDDAWANADVTWNGAKFSGSRAAYLKLVDFELRSGFEHKIFYDYGETALPNAYQEHLKGFFTGSIATPNKLTEGNVTVRAHFLVGAHGGMDGRANLGDRPILQSSLKKYLKTIAATTQVPIVYSSCYDNSAKLMVGVSVTFSSGELFTTTRQRCMTGGKWIIMVDEIKPPQVWTLKEIIDQATGSPMKGPDGEPLLVQGDDITQSVTITP